MRLTRGFLVSTGALSVAVAGCGQAPALRSGTSAADLRSYIAAVEPIRLAVNTLLQGADPIIEGFQKHTLTDAQAAAKMGAGAYSCEATTASAAGSPFMGSGSPGNGND